jgi:hypothetical protein
MTSQLISIQGTDTVSFSATEAAFDKRDTLALACGTVSSIANPEQAEHAAALLKEVKGFTRLIEDSRKTVKEPVLDLSRRIDTLAKELVDFLDQDANRISKLLGAYQMEQARLARVAQEKAYQDEQRILREAEEKKHVADETARSQAVSDRRIEKIEAQTFESIAQVRASAAAVAVASKPSGIATRMATKFEVTDIHALYAARPEMVKLEAAAAVINAVLRSNPKASIPGLRTWEEAAAIVR